MASSLRKQRLTAINSSLRPVTAGLDEFFDPSFDMTWQSQSTSLPLVSEDFGRCRPRTICKKSPRRAEAITDVVALHLVHLDNMQSAMAVNATSYFSPYFTN